jgi:hypothetical protein
MRLLLKHTLKSGRHTNFNRISTCLYACVYVCMHLCMCVGMHVRLKYPCLYTWPWPCLSSTLSFVDNTSAMRRPAHGLSVFSVTWMYDGFLVVVVFCLPMCSWLPVVSLAPLAHFSWRLSCLLSTTGIGCRRGSTWATSRCRHAQQRSTGTALAHVPFWHSLNRTCSD